MKPVDDQPKRKTSCTATKKTASVHIGLLKSLVGYVLAHQLKLHCGIGRHEALVAPPRSSHVRWRHFFLPVNWPNGVHHPEVEREIR